MACRECENWQIILQCPRCHGTGNEATGPSVGEAGAIDELEAFPDGWEEPKPFVRSPDLITIELTKEEAEYLLTDATPDRRGGWKVAADADMKLRAALKEAAP